MRCPPPKKKIKIENQIVDPTQPKLSPSLAKPNQTGLRDKGSWCKSPLYLILILLLILMIFLKFFC